MARTGSGKTAAFLIPLIEKLKSHSMRIGVRAVILSPTRELSLQTLKFAKSLAKFTDLRFVALVGGESMDQQFAALSKNPDVIIATPGRLAHMLLEVPGFHLKATNFVVFDEADRLFELGFADQLGEIITKMPEQRQAILVSATLPKVLIQFAKAGLKDPELIRLDTDTKVSENLRLAFFTIRKEEKLAGLVWTAREVIPDDQQALIFVSTRYHADLITELLRKSGLSADAIYGQMDQTARLGNLAKFRLRKTRFAVVTDVAARGLDLPLLDNVINYDFPDKPKLFVHRAGRVARQGRSGIALSFVATSELPYMLDLLLFLGRPVTNQSEKQSLDGGEGYSLATMDASDVHYGQIPRTALEVDLENVRKALEDDEIKAYAKSADNAVEMYNKTKAESSRTSVARSRDLPDDKIHPLLLTHAVEAVSSLRSYITGLQTFRPAQTIMELEPTKFKEAASILAAKRKFHSHAVAHRVGSVCMAAVAAGIARGTVDMAEFGDIVHEKLAADENRSDHDADGSGDAYESKQAQHPC
jgi:ATP-dependent RNA helicase DDX54/DBP10